MNIHKYYTRIAHALYQEPWMVLPSTHESLRKGFEAYLKGELPEPIISEETFDTEDIVPDGMTNGIAVISIDGVIGKRLGMLEQCMGGVDVDNVKLQLKSAMADDSIRAICLDINSPGGSVTGVPELAAFIAECNKTKKIYSFVDNMAASAAYYLASQTEAIFTTETAELGSVGVYMVAVDESRAIEDAGIKVNAITNDEATMKLAGASFKPLTTEERAMFKNGVQKTYDRFKSDVLSKRHIDAKYLNGEVFDGEDSVTYGFADGIVTEIEEVFELISQEFLQPTP